jgi:hypothetical protein
MDETVRSEIAGTAGLMLAAGMALFLSWRRTPKSAPAEDMRRTVLLFGIGLLLQSLHFVEEYATGFYQRFPSSLDLEPWPRSFFVTFNLCWLAIWAWAAVRLRAGSRVALWAVWFFALAGMANGVAHPLLAIRADGYFPGLITAPLVGVVGFCLFVRLFAITEPRRSGMNWRQIVRFFGTILFSA